MKRFFAFVLVALVVLFAPLVAAAASPSSASNGLAALHVFLGLSLVVGATITGSVRLDGVLYRPGQWESFLRAARESDYSPDGLKRLAKMGAVDLGDDKASDLLGGEKGSKGAANAVEGYPEGFPKAEALKAAGFDTAADAQDAEDDKLDAVEGVGEKTIEDIRAFDLAG